MKIILLCMLTLASVAHSNELSLTNHNSLTAIKTVSFGEQIKITDVQLDHLGTVSLNLKRFKVFADNAQVIIHEDKGSRQEAMPNNVYFTGTIQGLNDSRVFMVFLENDRIEGIVETADGNKFKLNWLKNNHFKLDKPDTDALTQTDSRYFNPKDFLEIPESEVIEQRTQSTEYRTAIDYQLIIAIETDYEFYQIFNDVGDEVDYISALIGYLSSMYYNEINTFVLLNHISVWTTANDPWDADKTDCALFEVGKYWNDNYGHIDRAATHFISGKNFWGGIAWQGVLCQSAFDYNISSSNCGFANNNDNYGGAYGVSTSLSGGFNPANPQPIWDIVVVSHEIGHNFDSEHTHCYNNPVDKCYNTEPSCYSGTQSLPGPVNQGSGTIMSYCHLLSGGLNNISLTLGKNHSFGVQPERVPNKMRNHVESRALTNPQCIMPATNDLIFRHGFEN